VEWNDFLNLLILKKKDDCYFVQFSTIVFLTFLLVILFNNKNEEISYQQLLF